MNSITTRLGTPVELGTFRGYGATLLLVAVEGLIEMRQMTGRVSGPLLSLLCVLCACATPSIDLSPEAAAKVREQDLAGLPYHPLVYHLDLSILTYQLYSQSLVWPFDPYYEDDAEGRDALMAAVRAWGGTTGMAQVAAGAGVNGYRGPGLLNGFEDNPAHDPIVYQYSRLHPWSTSITNPAGRWAEYLTPSEITSQISDVHVCYRTTGMPEGNVSREAIPARREDAAPGARDILLAIEGGTGDKGEDGQPASLSLMALALVRAKAGDAFDVHIAFRGSRSGVGSRTALEALSGSEAMGNPDWITDLGYDEVRAPFITDSGEVSRGISRSVRSIMPQLFECLAFVGNERVTAPDNIYVTGHSLGGGLAQHFVSSLFRGDPATAGIPLYGSSGDEMPESLRGWPWPAIKLITYSAPRVGNEAWARPLTEDQLQMQFFVSGPATPYDREATGITDPEILPRLTDPARPAAYRVLIPTDPITSASVPGGEHVGRSVYTTEPGAFDALAPPDFEAHEPANVRQQLIDTLDDDRVPPTAWAYHEMTEFNPSRDDAAAGSAPEYEKLADAVRDYHVSRDIWFDTLAFDESFETFLGLLPTM